MDNVQIQESIPKTLREISMALSALRGALVELSLLLQDLQFAMDQEERHKADIAFQELFERMRTDRGSDQFRWPR